VTWAAAVRQLYDEGQTWLTGERTWAERRRKYTELSQRAEQLAKQYAFASAHPCWALAKRLLRHQDELFPFVLQPGGTCRQ
jgi:hypothetical protein